MADLFSFTCTKFREKNGGNVICKPSIPREKNA